MYKDIVRGASIIALTVVLQLLLGQVGGFTMMHILIVGSALNTCLILTVYFSNNTCIVLNSVLEPILVCLFGQIQPLLILPVAITNLVFCFSFCYIKDRIHNNWYTILVPAVIRGIATVISYNIIMLIMGIYSIDRVKFIIPLGGIQVITALIGILIAIQIKNRIKFTIS